MKKLIPLAMLAGLVLASCSGSGTSSAIPPQGGMQPAASQPAVSSAGAQSAQSSTGEGLAPDMSGSGLPFNVPIAHQNLTGGSAGSYAYAIAATGVAAFPKVGPLCNLNSANDRTHSVINISLLGGAIAAPTAYAGYITTRTPTTLGTQSVAHVEHAKIAGGLITADAIKAVANSWGQTSALNSSGANSQIVGLKVAGVTLPNPIPVNFHVAIPLVGNLYLNSQTKVQDANSTKVTVTMFQLNVGALPVGGLPAGTTVIIAHAESSFSRSNTCVF